MEGRSKLPNIEQGLPPCWPKRATDSKPFSMMASSSLSLNPGSFQVWRKPYFMNYAGIAASSSGTKPISQNSDAKTTLLAMLNENDQKRRNPSPRTDKSPIPSGDISNECEPQPGAIARWVRNIDPNMDSKKLRRIISNRVSAQKSRLKKLQYITDLERKVKALEAQVAVLHPQLSLYRNQQELLQMEQKRLNQRMATYTNNSILRDVEIEENKAEVIRLRQLHLIQQQQQMQGQIIRIPVWESGLEEMMNPGFNSSGLGQLVYVNPKQGQYGEKTEDTNRLSQLESKQRAVQCGDEKAETNGHNVLFNIKQQQKPGEKLMPCWEPGQGQMPNQSGPLQKENKNSNLGGIEQILSLNVSQN